MNQEHSKNYQNNILSKKRNLIDPVVKFLNFYKLIPNYSLKLL